MEYWEGGEEDGEEWGVFEGYGDWAVLSAHDTVDEADGAGRVLRKRKRKGIGPRGKEKAKESRNSRWFVHCGNTIAWSSGFVQHGKNNMPVLSTR